jgi:nucleoside-diphosphate-sugar epimerase
MKSIMKKGSINDVFDLYSAKPVSKFALLKHLQRKYGLRYSIREIAQKKSPTGVKNLYYSKSRKAEDVGYFPKRTSLEVINDEIRHCVPL